MYSLYFPSVCAETGSLISQQQDRPEAKFSSVKEPALLSLEDLNHPWVHPPSFPVKVLVFLAPSALSPECDLGGPGKTKSFLL